MNNRPECLSPSLAYYQVATVGGARLWQLFLLQKAQRPPDSREAVLEYARRILGEDAELLSLYDADLGCFVHWRG